MLKEEDDYGNRVDAVAKLMKDLGLTADDFPFIADSLQYEENTSTPLPPSDEED